MTIYQDVSICLGFFTPGTVPNILGNQTHLSHGFGIHLMVLDGKFQVGEMVLEPRDAAEITDNIPEIICREPGKVLVFIVPLF